MKKVLLIPIILGSTILLVGGAFITLAIVNGNKNHPIVVNNYTFEDEIKDIHIDLDITDLEIKKSEDNTQKVIVKESDKLLHDVYVVNSNLVIRQRDIRKWYEKIFDFNYQFMKVEVYLPNISYGDVNIKASTGNIDIGSGFTFNSLTTKVSTGNVLSKADVSGNLDLSTSTGSISLINVHSNRVTLNASTGDISTENLIVNEHLRVQTSTGNVRVNKSDADTIDVETSTGDVYMSLLSEKNFDIVTSTGDKHIPTSYPDANICKVKTSTGNINIEYAAK